MDFVSFFGNYHEHVQISSKVKQISIGIQLKLIPVHLHRYYNKIDEIIENYAPLKKLSKKEIKIQAKPWITKGIRISIERRDKILRKHDKPGQAPKKETQHRPTVLALTCQMPAHQLFFH